MLNIIVKALISLSPSFFLSLARLPVQNEFAIFPEDQLAIEFDAMRFLRVI